MSSSQWLPPKVVPAQLAFLAIYNPDLGPTDETFADQCVFWYSRAAHEARIAAKKNGRSEAAGGDAAREEENEKLRQIGLAQGMVHFARSFSDGEPVDSVETEKSRVVLQELESGWWVLASIDLTRLPSVSHTAPEPTKKGTEKVEAKPAVEYSSREVSPPALLTQQLLQAHYIFQLHHGPSLTELFVRLQRDKFCNALDRFWARFCRQWDVLLHGNPAADVFSGLKLASGGELGFGVGEEEWGSGEREVLEDLADRTEGLVDLVVSRFGEPATAIASDGSTLPEQEALPWMGGGIQPIASDGIVFGGTGAIARPSLRNVSLWMRQIYTYGEYAYGVRDNVSRVRHKRRRRNPPEPSTDMNGNARAGPRDLGPTDLRQRVQRREAVKQQVEEMDPLDPASLPPDKRPQIHGSAASRDHAAPSAEHTPPLPTHDRPGIPPPIVSAAEHALDRATQKAHDTAEQDAETEAETEDAGSSTILGIPDQYMKYLTFGLSELGRASKAKRPPAPDRTPTGDSAVTVRPQSNRTNTSTTVKVADPIQEADEEGPMMIHMEPMPDGETLKAKIAMQKRRENEGHFVIGLKGDLNSSSHSPEGADEDAGNVTDGSANDDSGGERMVLRTIQVEIPPQQEGMLAEDEGISGILQRKQREADLDASAPASITTSKDFRRVRVLVYVHRPFIYCFLFEDRTGQLSYAEFYKALHRNLLPIHKPLLSSTSVAKVAQRIESSHDAEEDAASVRSAGTNRLPAKGGTGAIGMRPIFDLIFDPRLLTVHTSLPNIPDPGTSAAEGLGMNNGAPPGWTRVEALNVHSQILSTLQSIKRNKAEIERTSKTSRGWWVVWMRVPPSAPAADNGARNRDGGREGDDEADSAATMHAEATGTEEDNAIRTHGTPTPSATYFATHTVHHHRGGKEGAARVDMSRMAFLVRKSSADPTAGAQLSGSSRAASSGGMWSTLAWMPGARGQTTEEKAGGASAGWGPGALAGGVGIDARRYVEGLLSLNR
ncbi:hypothetical protein LTR85_006918 [Meristemomyces frigidus]|nr:hypothetical protein LTR85_006918 [Meristemomyces frigidus]